MADNKQEVANRLLDGLVEHLLAKLSPAQLDGLIEQELDYALDVATRYTLNDWVSAEQIRITAQKYAAEMDISGAIPELVGDMVEQFYDHGIQSDRLIGDVVDEDVVMALLDKVLEIPLSRQSMAWLGRNPVLLALLAGGAQLVMQCRPAGWAAWKCVCRNGCSSAWSNCSVIPGYTGMKTWTSCVNWYWSPGRNSPSARWPSCAN